MHAEFDLTEIALVALVALGCGILLERIKQPAVLGYILAGVILGPSVFALVENRASVDILAELGVLMLLFVVGMELHLEDFKKTWHISLSCTLLQIVGSFIAVYVASYIFNLSTSLTVLLAFAVALSSTAVAVKMLEGIGELDTDTGRLTIGVLIAQDLAIVPMILIIRNLNTSSFDASVIIKIILSLLILAGVIWALGRRESLKIPFASTVYSQPDLVPLLNVALCLGFASISGMLGLSAAYGAFIAGLILGNTAKREKLMKAARPLQSILMMVFFLSIGLLMDLRFIWENIFTVVFLLLIITFVKSLLNISILHVLGQPWTRSFLSGLLLAQMGEFAFVLTTVGSETGILSADGRKLVISLAALSLAFSPFWLAGARRLLEAHVSERASFNVLLDTAFGNELHFISKVTSSIGKACKKIVNRVGKHVGKDDKNDKDDKSNKA